MPTNPVRRASAECARACPHRMAGNCRRNHRAAPRRRSDRRRSCRRRNAAAALSASRQFGARQAAGRGESGDHTADRRFQQLREHVVRSGRQRDEIDVGCNSGDRAIGAVAPRLTTVSQPASTYAAIAASVSAALLVSGSSITCTRALRFMYSSASVAIQTARGRYRCR